MRGQAAGHILRTRDDQNGVITGDAAQDAGEHGVIDSTRQHLGGSSRCAQDQLTAGPFSCDQQVRAPARQARGCVLGHGAVLRNGSPTGAKLAGCARLGNRIHLNATGTAHFGGAQLDKIARERRLGGRHAVVGQSTPQLGLRSNTLLGQDLSDKTVASRLGRRRRCRRFSGAAVVDHGKGLQPAHEEPSRRRDIRTSVNVVVKASASASDRTKGGASLRVSGRGALTMKPRRARSSAT